MFNKLVDMALTAEEKEARASSYTPCGVEEQDYPYGLSICLDETSLAKLGLDADCSIDDLIHLNVMAKVTGVNKNSSASGEKANVNLQIIFMGLENESHEDVEEESDEPDLKKNGYLRYNR